MLISDRAGNKIMTVLDIFMRHIRADLTIAVVKDISQGVAVGIIGGDREGGLQPFVGNRVN